MFGVPKQVVTLGTSGNRGNHPHKHRPECVCLSDLVQMQRADNVRPKLAPLH